MQAMGRFLVLATISALFSACGGNGNGKSPQVQIPDPPAAPVVTVSADIKRLIFSWDTVANADYYRLLENADGHSGYTQVGADIPMGTHSATRDIAVHRHDWVNALYMVQACNMGGCTGSAEVSTADVMLDTIGYFKGSNTYNYEAFGYAVALSADGNTLAVSGGGAVYLFQYDGQTWSQQAYVKPSDTEARGFGWAVSLSADGNTLAVGAPGKVALAYSGEVYLFRFDGTSWAQRAHIKASNTEATDFFGSTVALSADGNTLAVGARQEDSSATGINGDQTDNSAQNAGAVYLFRFDGTSWAQQAYIKASNRGGWFGQAVALSADGNTLAVGASSEDSGATGINGDQADISATGAGAVYLFRFDGTSWAQQAYVKASNTEAGDAFGRAVALSADGNTLAVGASSEDSGATGVNGDQTDNSAYQAGAMYLFRFGGTSWAQQAYIKPFNPLGFGGFGQAVALSADGNTLAAGARREDGCATGIIGDPGSWVCVSSGRGLSIPV
jgi:hypothetical protein